MGYHTPPSCEYNGSVSMYHMNHRMSNVWREMVNLMLSRHLQTRYVFKIREDWNLCDCQGDLCHTVLGEGLVVCMSRLSSEWNFNVQWRHIQK